MAAGTAEEGWMKPKVFIHTNDKQLLGAKVAEYALTKASPNRDRFDIRILNLSDYPHLTRREGQLYLREGTNLVWRNDNLQSFTPLRFLPPQLMGYQGRALVIDPDIFAVGDVYELLTRDMQGEAICSREMELSGARAAGYASSVMLLDCGKLTHWKWEEAVDELFDFQRDYWLWMTLQLEPEGTISILEPEWNDFDTLSERTKLLHNTERLTQPWKTGLQIDYRAERPRKWGIIPTVLLSRVRSAVTPGRDTQVDTYQPHPDARQERFFFSLVRECLQEGRLTEEFIRSEMKKKHVRPDAMAVLGSLDAV
jgi:hypothetical protein